MKRAFRVTWRRGGSSGIVAGESAGKARAQVFRNLLDVFDSRDVRFADIHIVRAPEHDEWAAADKTGHCVDEKFLPKESP